jgi:hypothetical protein
MALEAVATVDTPNVRGPARGWSLPTRIAYRFWSVYFGIYVLSTFMLQGLIVPNAEILELGTLGILRRTVEWAAANVSASHALSS